MTTSPLRVPDLPQGHIRSFRNIAEAPVCDGSRTFAYRRELPLSFRVERWIKDRLTLVPTKKERDKEASK